MKYLIAGLGNIGSQYSDTRHNIGFMIMDAWAQASNFIFEPGRYAHRAQIRVRNRQVTLIKPTTLMNLSGKAVRYYMEKEGIEVQNLLVVVDDISLPPGALRLRPSGSDGGHNGLKSINELIGTSQYPRLRVGIGDNFSKGRQSDYVLSPFDADELILIKPIIVKAVGQLQTFVTEGIQPAMNRFNTQPGKNSEGS